MCACASARACACVCVWVCASIFQHKPFVSRPPPLVARQTVAYLIVSSVFVVGCLPETLHVNGHYRARE